MSNINITSIINKVRNFEKSKEGKKRIKDYIDNCAANGVGVTHGGGRIITIKDMETAASYMIQTMVDVAREKNLPESVMAHFNSLTSTPPLQNADGTHSIHIFFSDDLSRFSLKIAYGKRKGEYVGDKKGDKLINIVSLFDTGMDAETMAYGIWDGYEALGAVAGLTHRDEMHFIRDAVNEFNLKFGSVYNVNAYISADPDYYAR